LAATSADGEEAPIPADRKAATEPPCRAAGAAMGDFPA